MHTAEKSSAALTKLELGANAEAIAFGCFQANQEPMTAMHNVHLVQQQTRRTIVIGHNDVDGAVIIDVAESRSATYFREGEGRTCSSGHFSKLLAQPLVVE